ncbi:MAG: hypothetical protein A2511_06415 [Deltaproteobacteria bacterium RIFOXYD12_FULL_50_9]|nr:MAG: hypothetical protein A2511_06415 [Deltaproteobacteria bacterium RIFOXYD12_FULL_50_9]
MFGKKITLLLLLTAVLLSATGCGYRNPYTAPDGSDLPTSGIYIKMWENRTSELGFESMIRQSLTDWLIQSKHLKMRATAAEADYELSGTILSVSYLGTSYDLHDQATTLKAVLHLSFTLKEAKTGKVIWDVTDILKESAFAVADDAVFTRSNKQKVLETMANEAAEDIYLRIFYTLTQKNNPKAK